MPDIINVTILDDGTLKVETDRISAANHIGAEMLLREIAKLAGGPVKVTHKHGAHGHIHTHEHEAHQH